MTFGADQTWGPGGALDEQILNTTGVAGVDWDKIVIDGDLTITATAANPFLINLFSLSDPSTNGLLAGFDPTSNYHWLFLTAQNIFGFDPGAFSINAAGFENSLDGGRFSVHQEGGSLYLNFHPVPNPPPSPSPASPASAWPSAPGGAVDCRPRNR